jgi:membrane-associated protease RseP (regulator of RpoE activity)
MRGVDLNQFDFDYDLTWAGFFLNSKGKVYGRFGGRDSEAADAHLTLAGLKHAMRAALARHQKASELPAERLSRPVSRPEELPAGQKLKANACIHCHQVYEFSRAVEIEADRFDKKSVWVYPSPTNLGLTLASDEQDRVASVKDGSAAAAAGVRAGDVLKSVGGRPVASFADVQYALHYAPAMGELAVTYERAGKPAQAKLRLAQGWREGDISWRGSMWGIPPVASVYGQDLTPDEKTALGLGPKALAFKQGDFVPHPAAKAGIQAKDIILGVEGKTMEMNMLQFNVYIRMNYEVGDRVPYALIRNGKRMTVTVVLEKRDF